jgi:hypothetical protein
VVIVLAVLVDDGEGSGGHDHGRNGGVVEEGGDEGGRGGGHKGGRKGGRKGCGRGVLIFD